MEDLESVISSAIADSGASTTTETTETPTETTEITTETAESATSDPQATATDTTTVEEPVADAPTAPEGQTPPEDTLETLQSELAGKRDNRIPYSRVKKIVENAEKKAREAVEATYKTPEFQNSMRAIELADANPEQFLSALAQSDPRYAKLLAPLRGGGGEATAAAKKTPPADIKPNIQLSDGTLGYDAEAVNGLLERQAAQLRQEFDERLGSFAPVAEDYQTRQLRANAESRVAAQLEVAKNWRGFNDEANQVAMGNYMMQNPKADLRDAYIAVVVPKLQADETAIRKKIAEEMKKQSKASSGVAPSAAGGAQQPSVVVAEGADPIEAAIRTSISGLK